MEPDKLAAMAKNKEIGQYDVSLGTNAAG